MKPHHTLSYAILALLRWYRMKNSNVLIQNSQHKGSVLYKLGSNSEAWKLVVIEGNFNMRLKEKL